MTTLPRDDMRDIQARLNRKVEQIRGNANFSESGKRTELAKAVRDARRQRDELKTNHIKLRDARRESLQRSLFGIQGDPTPEQIMILRDSRDRAAKLDGPEDAATSLALANAAGDTYMAQAIAMVAATKGWTDVAHTYAETAGGTTRHLLDQLADIPSGGRTNLADAAVFTLREPDELRHHRSDYDIDSLASGDAETIARVGRTSSYFPSMERQETVTVPWQA